MTVVVNSGADFECVVEAAETGLVGTISLKCDDNQGNTVFGPSTADIFEIGTTGVYRADRTAPVVLATAQFTLIWSLDGTYDPLSIAIEDLVVSPDGGTPLPPIPPPEGGGAVAGPCTAWTTPEAVAECHPEVGTDTAVLEASVDAASQVLFELSGRQFSGLCERTVRPCGQSTCWPGPQVLEGSGYVVWPGYWTGMWWWYDSGQWCGCEPLSEVMLPGLPVRQILEVKIDGAVIDPSEYRLDYSQMLVRLRNSDGEKQWWPSCQNLDEANTEPGTWSVRYQYGQEPPGIGQRAAEDLAWQIFLSCAANSENCKLPGGVTRRTRQGVTVEMAPFLSWAQGKEGVWHTGFPTIDLFLSTYNPKGVRRRSAFMSPDGRKYAYIPGT